MNVSRRTSLAALLALILCALPATATNVGGTISSDTTWSVGGSPYIATSTVTIASGVTLTIDPGVTVKFNSATALTVSGKLSAVGTSGSGIVFTSNAGTPAAGDWRGINFDATANSTSQISYATVTYAGNFYNNGISIAGGSLSIDHVTVSSSGRGVVVTGGTPTLDNVTSTSNSGDGIYISGSSTTPTITNATVTSNGGYGINLASSGGMNLATATITGNTNYAVGAEGNTRIVTASGLTVSGNGGGTKNAIGYRGGVAITGNETWHAFTGLPFEPASSTVTVNSGASLTIDPGVTVRFGTNVNMDINGKLTAIGTSGSPITFTSNAASPAPGAWYAIYFRNGADSTSRISYASVLYAGAYWGAGIRIDSGTMTIDNVTVSSSSQKGVAVYGGTPTLDFVTATGNTSDGIYISGSSTTPTISNATVTSNGGYGINLVSGGGMNLATATITGNTNYAVGAEGNTRLVTASSLTVSGNGSGTKNAIGYRGGVAITGNESWHAFTGLPFEPTSSTVTVNSGASLTIDPGVTVRFGTNVNMDINGKLTAVGTSGSPITFTSNAASPAPGAWYAIYFRNGADSTSRISYASVLYAGAYWGAGIRIDSGTMTIDNVTVSSSSQKGVAIYGGAPTLSTVTTTACTGDGIYISGSSTTPTISSATVTNNGGYGINLVSGGGMNLATATITGNTNYAVGAEGNTRLVTASALTVSGNGGGSKNAIGYRGSAINTNEAWHAFTGLPWEPTSTVTVNSGASLTVDSGATVRFAANVSLDVYGKLTAVGTSGSPITFTSNAASPSAGAWRAIYLRAGSDATSRISYASVLYGGSYWTAGIRLEANATVDHVTVSSSSVNGIYIYSASPTIHHATLSSCSSSGIRVDGYNSAPVIHNNAFSGNAAGVTNLTANRITARLNYWNAADGPSGRGPGTGQSVSTGVNFDPWLTAAPSDPEYVNAFTFSQRRFNPTQGDASWTLGSSLGGNWTLTVKNGGGTTVRTITGSGSPVTLSWDAKDGGGTSQPDGTYSYLLDVASGGDTATTAKGLLFVDRTYNVSITSPASVATVSNIYQNGSLNVPIVGSVTMANLASWTLEYGSGAAPIEWTNIVTSTAQVSSNTLGTWATGSLANGLYTVRLSASDTSDSYTVITLALTVGNFSASQNVLQTNTASSGTVTYTSIVPFTVTETLVLKNAAGQTVRTLVNTSRNAATYNDVWNGKNDSATLVPDGPYFYVITVTDGTYTMTWDLTTQYRNDYQSYNDGLNVQPFDPFDNQPMTFTYNFSQPGQIYIGMTPTTAGSVPPNCDPPNFCLAYGKYEESGSHTITWAGVDGTGALRPDIQRIGVVTQRYQFSKNAVVIYGTKPTVSNVTVTPARFEPLHGTQAVSFSFTTNQSQSATVRITFLNQNSLSVLRTITLTNQSPGTVNATWDGKADDGSNVAPGNYTVTATVTDGMGNSVSKQILTTLNYY